MRYLTLHCLGILFSNLPRSVPMQKYTFFIITLLITNFSFWSFAQQEVSSPLKILLFAENNLKQNDSQITKRFSNALSASLADVRMRVISPEFITQRISSTEPNGSSGSPYSHLTENNKITLAKQLNANAILSANLNSFTSSKAVIPKFDRTVLTLNLSVNYKFTTTDDASAFFGDRLEIEKKNPFFFPSGFIFLRRCYFGRIS